MKLSFPFRNGSPLLGLVLCSVVASATTAFAQSSDEIRAKELQAKIKKDMSEIDALLLNAEKASPTATKEKIEEVKKNLDELLKGAQTKQSQVMTDIEELIKLAKSKPGGKGSGKPESNDPNSQQQEGTPERPQEKDVDELKRQQEEQKRKEQEQAQQNGEKPSDAKPDPSKGEQTKGDEKPDGEKGQFEREDVRGRWGILPPKVAEQLQKLRNGTYPERYRSLIERYYRSQAQQDSKKR